MKTTLKVYVLLAVILLVGCTKVIDAEQLQERGGLYYQVNASNPFTGTAQAFHENGQKNYEYNYVDGEFHGLSTEWYEDGQKESEANLVDGKLHGLVTFWYENGQKESEANFVDGEEQSLSTWSENG
jgi:antitoxin component YwqK of YwqJK toxin-antitoxin module